MTLTAADIDRFAGLSAAWAACAAGKGAAAPALLDSRTMRGLRDAQLRIVHRGAWVHGPSSLMAVLGLSRKEVANCSVVRWLLDPLSHHGLGAAMIEALAAKVGVDAPEAWMTAVETEVVRTTSRADVVLNGPTWTIVVEAKIDAPEGCCQASRLETDWPEADCLVFLTVRGLHKPVTASDLDRWIVLDWRWLATTASQLATQTPCRTTPGAISSRRALEDWIEEARRSLQ